MKLALVTPLDERKSGIASYARDLIAALHEGHDPAHSLSVYSDDVESAALGSGISLAGPVSALEGRSGVDLHVYQIGNSPAHASIYRLALRQPGLVVLHEFVLLHLRLWMALGEGRCGALLDEVDMRHGANARAVVEQATGGQFSAALFRYPLVEPLIAASRSVIVHSAHAAGLVRAVSPQVPVFTVPMGVPPMRTIDAHDARARLGIAPGTFVVGSIGHLNAYKRLGSLMRAVGRVVDRGCSVQLLLVGSPSANYDVAADVHASGAASFTRVAGFVNEDDLAACVSACDVCVNLRHPTAGETSASVLRLMSAGKPMIVSDTGAFTELPDGAVAKVPVGPEEEDVLVAYLEALIERPDLRAALGAHARAHVAARHSPAQAARGYMEAALTTIEAPAARRTSSPVA